MNTSPLWRPSSLAYAVIVLEEQTEINKAATALVLGVPWLESYAPASSDLRDLGESTGLEATQWQTTTAM